MSDASGLLTKATTSTDHLRKTQWRRS